jgi:hypothetical protein
LFGGVFIISAQPTGLLGFFCAVFLDFFSIQTAVYFSGKKVFLKFMKLYGPGVIVDYLIFPGSIRPKTRKMPQ